MSKLKVGMNVVTVKYPSRDGKEYWYEGMIMKLFDKKIAVDSAGTEKKVPMVRLQPVQAGSSPKDIPREDVAFVKDIGKNRYIPIEDYQPPNTGRKLKPNGKVLPEDYGHEQ